jgi:hypothetical protein|tara:strand:- start:973 stop:1281 length:309 start_codon:yes stop_codon:yes gene_type:complete
MNTGKWCLALGKRALGALSVSGMRGSEPAPPEDTALARPEASDGGFLPPSKRQQLADKANAPSALKTSVGAGDPFARLRDLCGNIWPDQCTLALAVVRKQTK